MPFAKVISFDVFIFIFWMFFVFAFWLLQFVTVLLAMVFICFRLLIHLLVDC